MVDNYKKENKDIIQKNKLKMVKVLQFKLLPDKYPVIFTSEVKYHVIDRIFSSVLDNVS